MTLRRGHLWAVVLLAALTMRIASEATASLSYLVIAGYALLGRTQAIQALALSWLFSMLNPGLAPLASAAAVGRYAVLAAATLAILRPSIVPGRRKRSSSMVFATLLLGVFLVIHSFLFSPLVDVSVLKAVSWTVAMATLVAAWTGLAADERDSLVRQLFTGLTVLMVVSLPFLALPVGYLRNGSGFQGVLNHPQVFGPTMALMGAWAASQLFGQKRPPWAAVVLVAASLVLVILSEARTGGLAMALGVAITVLVAPALAGRSIRTMLPGLRSPRVGVVTAVALAGMLVAGSMLSERLDAYISKRGGGSNLAQAYETSRGAQMERMLGNIQKMPLQGIGFGIASDAQSMAVQRDPVFDLPISATTEKGVLPLAVLEELGLFGFMFFAAWIWLLVRRSARGGIPALAVCLTALLINMGESTLFSPSGFGLLLLILLGWAFASGQGTARER